MITQDLPEPRYRTAITQRIRAASPTLEAAANHLLAAPGKGVRPLCLRLIGMAMHPQGRVLPAHETLAEAIELVHVGSLIHDDILDAADTRRGLEAVHVAYGAKVAVLAGDYLLAKATVMVAELGDPQLNARLAEMIAALCEGELLQDEQAFDPEVGMEAYLERVAKKTAAPFEMACEGGALISGATRRQAAGARRFGFHLGRLFQLVDDMLDWRPEPGDLGKPVGQDLVAGAMTLPVLVALSHPTIGPKLLAALRPHPETVSAEIRALVLHPEPLNETLALIEAEAERARQWLYELPPTDARDQLASMLEKLVERAQCREVV